MDRTRQRELAESLFDRKIKRENETDSALKSRLNMLLSSKTCSG
jgi:hypothetical protein